MIRTGLAGLLVVAPLVAATGQMPADRQALDRFSDSLSVVTVRDTASLRTTFNSLDRSAKDSRDPLLLLKAGARRPTSRRVGRRSGLRGCRAPLAQDDRPPVQVAIRLARLGMAEAGHAKWQQADRLALGNRVGVESLEAASECYRRALMADSSSCTVGRGARPTSSSRSTTP